MAHRQEVALLLSPVLVAGTPELSYSGDQGNSTGEPLEPTGAA